MRRISYSLVLAVLGIALLVGAASADNTATVTGTLQSNTATVDVNVPSVAIGTFAFGDNTKEVSGFIHVATNYDVKLQAAESGGDGKMSLSTDPNTKLTNVLKVGIGGFGPAEISGSEVDVSGTISSGTNANYDGKFVQKVVPADSVGSYTITVTFTAVAAS